GDADLVRRRRVALGRVAGALFVTHEDVPDRRRSHELVVERQDGSARQAEDILDSEVFERAKDGARAGEHLGLGRRRSGRFRGRAGGRNCFRWHDYKLSWNVVIERTTLPGDGTHGSGMHELVVLREDAAGVTRR